MKEYEPFKFIFTEILINTTKKHLKHFSKKDISWRGKIKDASLNAFIDKEFDMLINYNVQKNIYIEYVTLKSKAIFKVGFKGLNDNLFDMVIKEDIANVYNFNKELKKYLQILNKI